MGVLVICLLGGILAARLMAPEPVVGVIRFNRFIDIDAGTDMVDLLDAARRDDRIGAVVIEVESPGGYTVSTESIYYAMLQLRAEKPVVVFIDGLAASGGYYISAAANRIYTSPGAEVGNIGTRGPRPGDPVLSPDELSSGPYKLSGGSRFDFINQLLVQREGFVNNIMAQRLNADNPLTLDKSTVEEARIYLGSEAVAVGLVDALGSRTDAILGAAEIAGLSRYNIVTLTDYLGISMPVSQEFALDPARIVKEAPPGTTFLLDTRVPLPTVYKPSAVEQHMLDLREAAPASIQPKATEPQQAPQRSSQPTSGGEGGR